MKEQTMFIILNKLIYNFFYLKLFLLIESLLLNLHIILFNLIFKFFIMYKMILIIIYKYYN